MLNSPNTARTQNDAQKPIENPVEQFLTKQTSRKYRKKAYTYAQVENVLSLSQLGFTATQIGEQLAIPRRTVSQWIHEPPNYLLMGSSSLSSVGSGRVQALRDVVEEEIGKLILFGRSIKCETTKQWVQDFVKRIKTDTHLKYTDTWFQGLRKRLKKTFRLNLTPRQPATQGKNWTEPDVIATIQEFWKHMVKLRLSENLQNKDLIYANDEMSSPHEVHSKIIYDLAGVRHPLIKSNQMESVKHTTLYGFTLIGRKFPPVFIFHGEVDKNLQKESRTWSKTHLPKGQNAYVYFTPSAFMTAWIYEEAIGLHWIELIKPYVLEKDLSAVMKLILPRWQQPSWYGIQAEAEEAKTFPTLPRTYLIHDSWSAHTAGIVNTILKLRNVHQTTLKPIGHEDLQIFDTHLARSVRTGILAAYVIWMNLHPEQEVSTTAYRILANCILAAGMNMLTQKS